MKLEFIRHIFEKYSSIKIHDSSVGAELFHAGGRTDGQTDRQTDMMKPVVAFRNFANAPKYDFQIRIFYIKICRI
jgi:hypothetical protein